MLRAAQGRPVFLLLPSPSLPRWSSGKALVGSSPWRCEWLRAAQSWRRELYFQAHHRKSHRKLGRGVALSSGASPRSRSWPCPTLSCRTCSSKLCVWFMGANSWSPGTRQFPALPPACPFLARVPGSWDLEAAPCPSKPAEKRDPTAGYQHSRNAGSHPDATHRVLLEGGGLCVLLWLKNTGLVPD